MALGHHRDRHVQQNSLGIHKAKLVATPRESHRLALHDGNANLVWKDAHH